jgi:putative NADH-flavin reductase
MKVVIAGGRGKIAPLLEQLLFRRGDAVTGLTRNPAQAEALEKAGAQARPVDPEKATSDEVARRLLTFSGCLRVVTVGDPCGMPVLCGTRMVGA